MRFLGLIIILILFNIHAFSQEIEFFGSKSLSSEIRFVNACGYGLQYQQKFLKRLILGLGIDYRNNLIDFDNIWTSDFGEVMASKESSNSQCYSIRLNFQIIILNKEAVLISFGPDLSYNLLKGKDQINLQSPAINKYYEKLPNSKRTGQGLIFKFELKDLIIKKIDLVLNILSENLSGRDNIIRGLDIPYFSYDFNFIEFQIGLKYRINRKLTGHNTGYSQ
jgi:hypothetical protein